MGPDPQPSGPNPVGTSLASLGSLGSVASLLTGAGFQEFGEGRGGQSVKGSSLSPFIQTAVSRLFHED